MTESTTQYLEEYDIELEDFVDMEDLYNIEVPQISFEGMDAMEIEDWWYGQLDAFEDNQIEMEELFTNWMDAVYSQSFDAYIDMDELHAERDAIAQETIMEAAEYVSEHVTIDGQTLSELMPGVVDEMAMMFPDTMPEIQTDAVMLFGLDQIKLEEVPVTEVPSVSFNFNEDYLWDWVSEIEDAATDIQTQEYDNMMQLGEELYVAYEEAMAALEAANERDEAIREQAYELDSRVMFDSMNFVFDSLTVDGLSAGDIWPDQRAIAISDALEAVREGYEMFGLEMEATQEELDARAVADAYMQQQLEAEEAAN